MRYISLSAPWIRIKRLTITVKLWTAFYNPGIQWGFGLLQVNFWNFLYIGSDGWMFCEDMRNSDTYRMY